MKTLLKNLSDTKVQMTITLGKEELAVAEQVATVKLAREVKVPGFRKGKTPASVAAKNINPAILQETILDNAISKAVAEAFIKEDVQAIDRPAVEIKKYVPNELLEFTAETEVLPKVKLGNYKKLKVASEKAKVEDKEIDEIVERMRHSLSERKAVEREAKTGDEATIDFVGKKDGVAFDGGKGSDYPLVLGSNQFIPGFEEGIVGHKVGETFNLDLSFPEDYGVKDLKGAKVTFETTLKGLKEVVLPEVNDEFAAKTGPFKTVGELKADIKSELLAQKEQESGEKLKDDLVKQLVEVSNVPAPAILVQDQMKSIEQDFTRNLMYQGLTLDQYLEDRKIESKDKWLESEVKDIATKRVQAGLALAELSKIEKIEATVEEIDNRVELFKKQYEKNAQALEQLKQPEAKRDIANRLVTEKTVDRLVELNKK